MNDWVDAEKRIEQAQQHCEAKRWDEALVEIELALEINSQNRAWWNSKAYVLDQLERYEEAIEAYEMALSLGEPDRDMQTTLALDYVKVGELPRAAELFEELSTREPDYEPAYCHRIMLFSQMGDHDQAEEMFYLAQQLEEECPHCFWHLGCSLWARDQIRRALFCWQRVLEIEPHYRGVRRRIAEAYARLGDIDIAREYYLAEFRENPADLGLMLDLGELLMNNGQPESALEKFKFVAELDMHNPEPFMLLGDALADLGDSHGACRAYETAAELDEHTPGLQYKLGRKLMELGHFVDAKMAFDTGLRVDPDDPGALMASGNCALEVGDPDEAQRCFERIIELDGGLPGAYHNLGVCHFLRDEYEEGIRQCETAVSLKGDYGLARQKLVLAHMHIGQWDRARTLLDESLQQDPDNQVFRRLRKRWHLRRMADWAQNMASSVKSLVRADRNG